MIADECEPYLIIPRLHEEVWDMSRQQVSRSVTYLPEDGAFDDEDYAFMG
jgi:hypothetical protein